MRISSITYGGHDDIAFDLDQRVVLTVVFDIRATTARSKTMSTDAVKYRRITSAAKSSSKLQPTPRDINQFRLRLRGDLPHQLRRSHTIPARRCTLVYGLTRFHTQAQNLAYQHARALRRDCCWALVAGLDSFFAHVARLCRMRKLTYARANKSAPSRKPLGTAPETHVTKHTTSPCPSYPLSYMPN